MNQIDNNVKNVLKSVNNVNIKNSFVLNAIRHNIRFLNLMIVCVKRDIITILFKIFVYVIIL